MTVQVVIADEMDLALEGIKTILRLHAMFQVIGTHRALADLVEALKAQPPDVVLFGDRLEPDMDVLQLVERVQQAASRARLLVLGTLPSGLIVQELLSCGAAGYLYKNDPLSSCLAEAIHTVLQGRPYLSPTANAEYLLAMQTDRAGWRLDPEARDVLRLLAQGQRPQEIAFQRHVPVRRVYNVCERLRRRFGVETNEELMVRAAEEGFLHMKERMKQTTQELPILEFQSSDDLRTWLMENHETSDGIWIRIYKANSGLSRSLLKRCLTKGYALAGAKA